MAVDIEQQLLKTVIRANWVLFVAASLIAWATAAPAVARGVFLGGLIVTVSFHLLYRTLRKAFRPPHVASFPVVMAKYYVRFAVTGVIIFFLISRRIVHPIGLLIGLSIVVISIILATVRVAWQSRDADAGAAGKSLPQPRNLLIYGKIGTGVAGCIFGGLGGGILLDRRVLDSSPWFTLIGLVLGIAAGYGLIARFIKRIRTY